LNYFYFPSKSIPNKIHTSNIYPEMEYEVLQVSLSLSEVQNPFTSPVINLSMLVCNPSKEWPKKKLVFSFIVLRCFLKKDARWFLVLRELIYPYVTEKWKSGSLRVIYVLSVGTLVHRNIPVSCLLSSHFSPRVVSHCLH
jgi:hypothetical protein